MKGENTLRLSGFAFEKRKWIYDLSENNLRKNITALTRDKSEKSVSLIIFTIKYTEIRFDENFIELTLHYLFCATSPIRAISGVG